MALPDILKAYIDEDGIVYVDAGELPLKAVGVIITSGVLISGTLAHGSLQELGDDDHPQYILVDGTRSFTSTVGGITPTVSSHLATKGYVDAEITGISGSFPTLQDTYDDGDGVIITVAGKPVTITGTGSTGTFTSNIISASNSLTISGQPVSTGTGGTTDHSVLTNLDFANAGHTGFASESGLVLLSGTVDNNTSLITTTSGHLQTQIDGIDVDEADVNSLNTLQGDVTLSGLGGTSISESGQVITISGLSLDELEHFKAFGELYQENDSGTFYTITTAGTYVKWTTSVVGNISTDSTVSGSATNDNLTILASGAGDYLVSHSTTFNSGNLDTIFTVSAFKSGTRIIGSDAQIRFNAVSRRRTLSNNSIIRLDVGDTVDLRFNSSISSRTLALFRANLSIVRIGRTGLGSGEGGGVTDHGNLTGLSDDDHLQYSRTSGVRPFTGTVGGVTPTVSTHLTTKGYVDGQVVNVSGHLQNQIDTIDVDEVEPAIIGVDGITVISGSSTTTVSGFRDEFVSASGSLQSQIDTIDPSTTLQDAYDNGDGTITTITGKPLELLGTSEFVAATGTFSTSLTISGQPVVIGSIDEIEPAIVGADGITVISGASTTTVSGFRDEFVSASGSLQTQISSIDVDEIEPAIIGADGITVISGSSTTTVSGFRDEFVAASGSLQTQIDTIDVDEIEPAIVGKDGITVISGTDVTTVSGFYTEFVAASGTLNDDSMAFAFFMGGS